MRPCHFNALISTEATDLSRDNWAEVGTRPHRSLSAALPSPEAKAQLPAPNSGTVSGIFKIRLCAQGPVTAQATVLWAEGAGSFSWRAGGGSGEILLV